MDDCVKILFLKEDLSTLDALPSVGEGINAEERLMERLAVASPDAIALDLTRLPRHAEGCTAIATIRRCSELPIIVVSPQVEAFGHYLAHGASECVEAPVDIGVFGRTVQRVVGAARMLVLAAEVAPVAHIPRERIELSAGIHLDLRRSSVIGRMGPEVSLTTAEMRLLLELIGQPHTVLSRATLGVAIYGRHQPVSERAIDVVVSRLRNKLIAATGEEARFLIKTEFRLGYTWSADLAPAELAALVRSLARGEKVRVAPNQLSQADKNRSSTRKVGRG